MNGRQMDKYSSLMWSFGWLKDNTAAVAGLASVPAHAADLQTTMNRLGWLMTLVDEDRSGYAQRRCGRDA